MAELRISLYGPTGSGKSTIAAHIVSRYDAELVKVSEPLHRLQEMFYDFLRLEVSGQDGELLQFLAGKIEREWPGWLGRAAIQRARRSACSLIVNDDCRLNSYTSLRDAGFIFVRVRTSREKLIERSREDHRPADPGHAVELGFDEFQMDHELGNDGPMDHTLAAADRLVQALLAGAGPTPAAGMPSRAGSGL